MLPIKLYPTFNPRHSQKKLELILKVQNRLPTNLRAKYMKISFKFPMKVYKVNFLNLSQQNKVLSFKDIHDMESLNKVASSWIPGNKSIQESENGFADCDLKKRKVVWTVNNFTGGTSKTLEVCLSYDKDVVIDEFQVK